MTLAQLKAARKAGSFGAREYLIRLIDSISGTTTSTSKPPTEKQLEKSLENWAQSL